MNPNCPFVAERAGHRCEYCHAPETIFNVPFEVEHIIPISKDGIDHESNWALACRACNLKRMNSPLQQTARAQWIELELFP